jgi:hypothetical protein
MKPIATEIAEGTRSILRPEALGGRRRRFTGLDSHCIAVVGFPRAAAPPPA